MGGWEPENETATQIATPAEFISPVVTRKHAGQRETAAEPLADPTTAVAEPSLVHACAAELFGTFLLVFLGTGAVFVGVLTGALQGLFAVAILWAVIITLIIYATSAISGAHINPAVTVSVAVMRGFPRRRIGPYILAQCAGAMLGSALVFALFSNILAGFETQQGLVRGEAGSQLAAMVFGEYFPNPAIFGAGADAFAMVSHAQAMLAKIVGTALLVFFVFALTDDRNRNRPDGTLFAVFIGLAVAAIIAVIAPLTQACLNPARDFGPRLVAWFVGYGSIAFPGPRGGFFTVYILSPLIGGLLGGWAYQMLRQRGFAPPSAASS